MKMLDETICLDDEVRAIAAYIGQKWSPIADLEQLVHDVRSAAEHAARVLFEDHAVWEVTVAAEDAREAMLTQKYGDKQPHLRYYDAGCQLIANVRDGLKDVRTAALNLDGPWDYSRGVDKVLDSLKSKYPDLIGARPNGWAELEAGYNDFDGQEEYDGRPDRELFQGVKAESVLAGDFVDRTALPRVIYDEKGQGLKAHYVLVGAIFAQFMLIAEYLNTRAVCKDLEAVLATLPQEHVFELALAPQTPVLKSLISMGKPFTTQLEYEEAVAHVAAYRALSDAERAAKDAECETRMADFMDELTKPSLPKSYEDCQKEQEVRIAPIRAVLREALGETSEAGVNVLMQQDARSEATEPRMRA